MKPLQFILQKIFKFYNKEQVHSNNSPMDIKRIRELLDGVRSVIWFIDFFGEININCKSSKSRLIKELHLFL